MLRTAIAAVVCAAITVPPMQTKQIVNAGPAPVGPYSSAVKAGGLIYLSGTLAQDDKGALVGDGDAAAQTRRIIERMRDVLKASGSSLEQVVAVTVYLRSAADFPVMNDTYKTFWPKDPPTRTTVITDLLLGADVEISMIAVPDGAERKIIHPADWAKSPNPYSYAIRTGDTLFLSGLVPRNGKDNTPVGGDITVQTKAVMENAGQLLKAAGMDFSNVVSARVYLPDAGGFQQMNEVYRSYFTSRPAGAGHGEGGACRDAVRGRDDVCRLVRAAPGLCPGHQLERCHQGRKPPVCFRRARSDPGDGRQGDRADAGDHGPHSKDARDCGYTPADVVDGIVYLTDLALFAQMNDEYRAFFGKDFPARATVGTGLMGPGPVVEIMVTAVKQ